MKSPVIPAQAGIPIDGAGLDSRLSGNDEVLGFGSHAVRLAGLAGAVLGWRPDDFWAATPAELTAVFSAFSDEDGCAVPAVQSDLTRLMEQFPDG